MSKALKFELNGLDSQGILFTVFVEPDGTESEIKLVTKCGSFRTCFGMFDTPEEQVLMYIRKFVRYVNGLTR